LTTFASILEQNTFKNIINKIDDYELV